MVAKQTAKMITSKEQTKASGKAPARKPIAHNNKFKAGPKFERGPKTGAGNRFDGPGGKPQSHRGIQNESNGAAAAGEKQDWTKFKQEKKDLKLKRKSSRDTYEITKEAKQIYEKLKCRSTQQKDQLVEQMYKILNVGDTISKIAKAHDTARVLQCMLKHGAPALRAELSEKLMPYVVEMCQSKYAQFCVLSILQYGAPATKNRLVDSLLGHVVRLAVHKIASRLLDNIYSNVATPQQRCYMRQEFYGDLYKKSKDSNVRTLEDTYKEAQNMKASILSAVKANLDHVANKELVDCSVVHAVMLEYVRASDEEKLEETVTAFAALVPHMLSSKDGSEAAIICFYKSTPKNRRAIIKNIKEYLLKIATHEHGHVFLIALLNALDDTKATKKAIYDHLHDDLQTLVTSPHGRRVLQWLVAPGDTSCFHPGFIKRIEEGLSYGKKDKETRRKEIFEQIEGPIVEAIVQDAAFWLSNGHIGLVTADILNYISVENYDKVVAALVQVLVQPSWTVSALPVGSEASAQKKKSNDIEAVIAKYTKERKKLVEDGDEQAANSNEEKAGAKQPKKSKLTTSKQAEPNKAAAISVAGIEDAGMHHALTKIIKNDKEHIFGAQLLKQLDSEVLQQWLSVNRGCFVLVKLMEQNAQLMESFRAVLKTKQLEELLLSQKTRGADLLALKLGLNKMTEGK